MGIVKVYVVKAADSDTPASFFQPANPFHHTVTDADYGIISPLPNPCHKIRSLMTVGTAVGPLKHPAVFIGNHSLLVLRGLGDREIDQILPDIFIQLIKLTCLLFHVRRLCGREGHFTQPNQLELNQKAECDNQ